MATSQVSVEHDVAASRYVLLLDGKRIGFASYKRRGGNVVITHTEVDPAFGDQGLGSKLVAAALDDLRASRATVVPHCPFVAAFVDSHPGYADLLVTAPAAVAERAFVDAVGRSPEGVWLAPGRVNLIGEHLDYNLGHVLPIAIGQAAAAAVGRRDDGVFRVWSTDEGGPVEASRNELRRATGWSAYLLGTVWALGEAGIEVAGLDVVLASDLPAGAGLASSAALECALAIAIDELAGAGSSCQLLARLAQRGENEVVGAPVGVMDQRASLEGRADEAILLDCRSGTVELVPFDLRAAGLELAVIDTGVRHRHAVGAYRQRRDECEAAARLLGVASLRDAHESDLSRLAAEPELERRARHVVHEEARVGRAAALLRSGDLAGLGPLFDSSHASLRDDFEVSVPELDAAVEAALAAGALGARMTGGGFGGSAIALCPPEALVELPSVAAERFRRLGAAPPHIGTVVPSEGARRVR